MTIPEGTPDIATKYQQFKDKSFGREVRSYLSGAHCFAKSLTRAIDATSGWIRFPFYHHVFDDERSGFARQLDYLKNFGDFISIDEAVAMLSSGESISGRFFCLTFDDGLKNCFTNALPILVEKQISAAFFLPTEFIGGQIDKSVEWNRRCWGGKKPLVEFLNWDECREMVAAGMIIGSHTVGHVNLIECDYPEIIQEMRDSKSIIERELGGVCHHFSCPYGVPGRNFLVDRHPLIAKEIGYRSFSMVRRGAMRSGDSPYLITRDVLEANLGNYMLRYYFSG